MLWSRDTIPDTQTKAPQSTSPHRHTERCRVPGIPTGHSEYPAYWYLDISDALSWHMKFLDCSLTRLNAMTETCDSSDSSFIGEFLHEKCRKIERHKRGRYRDAPNPVRAGFESENRIELKNRQEESNGTGGTENDGVTRILAVGVLSLLN